MDISTSASGPIMAVLSMTPELKATIQMIQISNVCFGLGGEELPVRCSGVELGGTAELLVECSRVLVGGTEEEATTGEEEGANSDVEEDAMLERAAKGREG